VIILSLAFALDFNEAFANPPEKASHTQPKVVPGVPSKEEFEKTIKENNLFQNDYMKHQPFFQGKDGGILSAYELTVIDETSRYLGSFGPKIIRPLGDFKGDTLLVGGERMKGKGDAGTNSIAKVDKIEPLVQTLADIGKIVVNPFTGEKITSEDKRKAAKDMIEKDLNDLLKPSKDKYYVSNIKPDVMADLIASAIDKKDMSVIPDGFFEKVYYESVDCSVFLFKDTWDIMDRITKPGGKITIRTAAISCMRLIPTLVKGTKWEHQVNEQIRAQYKEFATGSKFVLELID
jgi:hypothetical protein